MGTAPNLRLPAIDLLLLLLLYKTASSSQLDLAVSGGQEENNWEAGGAPCHVGWAPLPRGHGSGLEWAPYALPAMRAALLLARIATCPRDLRPLDCCLKEERCVVGLLGQQ